jgi:ABC-2 type transport system permease protein
MRRQVWRIAQHEVRQAWRSGALPALAAAIALLLLTAGYVGTTRHQLDQHQRQRYAAVVEGQWRDQPERHPHRVSHYGYLVFRPRAPLGFFDSGLESYVGTSIFLEAHRQNTANFSDAAQDSGVRRFGELTMATVLQMLVPLLIFAVAGVSVAREREHGTLAVLLSQAVSWRHLLAGKSVGSLLVVAGLAVPGAVLVLAWLAGRVDVAWTTDLAVRASLLAAGHMLFFAACAALAVLVSAKQATTRGALVTLTSLWLLLWIVVPRVLPSVATVLYPVPSRAAFDAEVERRVRALGDSHNPNDPVFQALRERTLQQHGARRIEDLPFNYNGVVMTESEKLTTEAYRAHLGTIDDAYARQARFVGAAGFISPYMAIRTLSMLLSGVDTAHAIEFERQAEDYRYRLVQHLNELHTEQVAYARDRYLGVGKNGAPTRQRIDRAHWSSTPGPRFTVPDVWTMLARQPLGAAALITWLVMATGALVATSHRSALP